MKKAAATHLSALDAAKSQYGPSCATRVEKLLVSLRKQKFADAKSLIHFHDVLLFLRAFPQSKQVVALTEELLAGLGRQVKQLRDSGTDLDLFDSEEFSGIAGTVLHDTATYEVARWLALRFPQQVRVEWNVDEQARQMSSALPQVLPLIADDCFVEADTPYLAWLSSAAGGEDRILPWLLRWLENAPLTMLQKTAWYDALNISLAWELEDSAATRTRARRNPRSFYCHVAPPIRRNQVSLEAELGGKPLAVRKLSRKEADRVLNFAREALTVRYRELWGTTRGDPATLVEADAGRGVRIFLWGLPPDRRLPLRAYHAGLTVKNGVPVNYFEAISLFEWMEVGFNTFYAFREGETGWIYSKTLQLLHQVANVTCFSVYPYQLGADNEEAIQSGAFWFYRKLGFRPGKPELLAITEREEKKIAAKPGYRTPARTLRKLADEHAFFEFGARARGQWDTFSIRNIGFTVQRLMAKKFAGDPARMRQQTVARLADTLHVRPEKWSEVEQAAFADFAAVLALVPELSRWSSAEKRALVRVIRAKAGADEIEYLRRLQQHDKLKQAMLLLGSAGS